ncbi:iron permease [Cubamyces lactineus]|nr:iron permease [Cubamyces lactineus]
MSNFSRLHFLPASRLLQLQLSLRPWYHPFSTAPYLGGRPLGIKHHKNRKGSNFWLSFLAILVSAFLSALDLTAIPTTLPTITDELNGGDKFIWVGSAYGLASAAILLLSGRFANIFGRKPVMLVSIAAFSIGSIIAGAAPNMDTLIAGRVVQGMGGGSILNMSQIITSDLVSLAERGVYQGMIVLVWALAAGVGPVIGGALAEKATWRWVFYLNLPLTGLAFCLVAFFLRVRSPEGSAIQQLTRIDWSGNMMMAAGSVLALYGLTVGGIQYPWNSGHVLVPLIVGIVLIAIFFLYELLVPAEPTLPSEVLANRTSLSGYLSTFIHGTVSISAIYYLPVYFQACLSASSIRSSVYTLPTALVMAPFSLLCGFSVKLLNKYRPANIFGWIVSIIGFGLLSLLRANSSTSQWVGFQLVTAVGTGTVYASTIFAVMAPLPISRTAAALALHTFSRTFAQTWGITIAGTILQNQLKRRLPEAFTAQFPSGVEIAYAAIPVINQLDEPLKTEVREAFAASMSVIWKTMTGLCGAGIFTLCLLREVPMVKHTDETYGLRQGSSTAGSLQRESKASQDSA